MWKEEWSIHVSENEKSLSVTRPSSRKSDSLSPCDMTPDDVDYEMSTGKNPKILEICGMNQKSFEHFVSHYAESYEYLSFFKCQSIADYAPLSHLKNLQGVRIYWNIKADRLWDMSGNDSLVYLSVSDAKKLTYELPLLNTSGQLEEFGVFGSAFNNYPMKNLDVFTDMKSLKKIQMERIKLENHDCRFLDSLPQLETFDFFAGMLTTEEIAWLCARYPKLRGKSLCAYNTEDAFLNDIRVCGYRKPGLDLPEQQKALDKHVARFQALVEAYRKELSER